MEQLGYLQPSLFEFELFVLIRKKLSTILIKGTFIDSKIITSVDSPFQYTHRTLPILVE